MEIYKHIVYNPHQQGISAVLDEMEKLDNSEWCFERSQPITEYEWVAIFRKWENENIGINSNPNAQ